MLCQWLMIKYTTCINIQITSSNKKPHDASHINIIIWHNSIKMSEYIHAHMKENNTNKPNRGK